MDPLSLLYESITNERKVHDYLKRIQFYLPQDGQGDKWLIEADQLLQYGVTQRWLTSAHVERLIDAIDQDEDGDERLFIKLNKMLGAVIDQINAQLVRAAYTISKWNTGGESPDNQLGLVIITIGPSSDEQIVPQLPPHNL